VQGKCVQVVSYYSMLLADGPYTTDRSPAGGLLDSPLPTHRLLFKGIALPFGRLFLGRLPLCFLLYFFLSLLLFLLMVQNSTINRTTQKGVS
jgi:hypothetical protein